MVKIPRDNEEIEELQIKKLKVVLHYVSNNSEFYKRKLKELKEPWKLPSLPYTTKSELMESQRNDPPFGDFVCLPHSQCSLIGFTGGPGLEVTHKERLKVIASYDDLFNYAVLCANGFKSCGSSSSDRTLIANEISKSILHHAFLRGFANLNSTPIQIGRGLTLRHVRYTIPKLEPTQILTYPTYSLFLKELLDDERIDLEVSRLFLWSEIGASVASKKKRIESVWDAKVYDLYAMEELGPLGIECHEQAGLHGFENSYVYEIADPKTGEILGEDEIGELVITTLSAKAMPLIRYRTGDITSIIHEPCSCGSSQLRLKGILGRIDESIDENNDIMMADIEEVINSFAFLSDNYRIIRGEKGATIEAQSLQKEVEKHEIKDVQCAIEALSSKLEIRISPEVPRFYHITQRLRKEGPEDVYKAMLKEQSRLEE